MVGSSGSSFTLNPSEENGTVVIAPTLDNGAAVYIDGDSAQSTLNIAGSVEISGGDGNRLTTDGASLVTVGDTEDGGHLVVTGDLTIKNADVYQLSGATVINVERGVYNGPGSSLTVGDVVVENVTVNNTKQGYPITSTSVLTVNGSTTSQPAEFTAGDITIVNSTADRVANFSNAKVETGKILVDNSSIGYGVNAGSNADVTIDSIEWKGTDLSSALLVAEKRADLVVRNGIVVEGDAENYIRATGTGDSGKLIRFHNNADSAVVGGDISLKYIEAQAGLIFAHEVNDKVAFADIVVDHVKIDAGQSAVQLGDDAKETFSLETGTISVSDLNYVEADRYQFGVKLSNLSDDTSVEGIYVDGIHYGEAGTNSGSNALGAGGISVSSSSFKDVVDTLSVKNITTTSEDSKIGYTGIYLSNVEGDIGSIVVDSLDSKGTGIETDGLSFSSGDLGYGQINIENVSSGGAAYGMKISGNSTLLNGIENASQQVFVSDIEGTAAYGVYTQGSGSEFSGKVLSVEDVTATNESATGLSAGTRLSFDAVTVKSVQGTKQVSGLALSSSSALNVKTLVVDDVKSTDAANTSDVYGINGGGAYKAEQTADVVSISNVSSAGSGNVYGFYNQDSVWEGTQLVIDAVSSENGNAFGFESYGYAIEGSMSYGPTSVDFDAVSVSNVSGLEAVGFKNYSRRTDTLSSVSSGFVSIDGINGTNSAVGLDNADRLTTSTALVRNVVSADGAAVGIRNSGSKASYESGVNIVDGVHGGTSATGFDVLTSMTASTVAVNDVAAASGDSVGVHIQKATLKAAEGGVLTLVATGIESKDGHARGVFIDGRNSILGETEFISVGNVKAEGGDAYGLHQANTTSSDPFGNTEGIFVQGVWSTGGDAYGLHLQNPTTNAKFVAVQDVSGDMAYGIKADSAFTASDSVFVGDVNGGSSARGFFGSKDVEISALAVSGVSASESWGTAEGVRHQAADSVVYNGAVTVSDVSSGNFAYGFRVMGAAEFEKVGSVSLNDGIGILSVEGKTAYGLSSRGKDLYIYGTTVVSQVVGTDTAVAVEIEEGSADFERLEITNVDTEKKSALVSAKNGAVISIGSTYMRSDSAESPLGYEGNFEADADSEANAINRIALRSVSGSVVNVGAETQAAEIAIVGDIVAGRGTTDEAEGGRVGIYAATGSQIFGDVYAGNGGNVTLMLAGSTLEGQIDDYHELATGTAEADSFRNADFYDDAGNPIYVTQAGSVHLTLADDSTWTARGKNFVESLTFSGTSSLVDLSQNENSSVTIGTLSGSNGVFRMKLGKPEAGADGLIHSDMLYISNIDADSQNRIEVVFADGVTSFEELDGLRFATSSHVDSTKHLQLNVENQGFFNRTLSVELEEYVEGDEENAKYNGPGNGEGVYKPGETAVDGMFDTGDTNWIINSKSDEEPVDPTDPVISDAGQTILGTARATYWNAVILDRWNQRYGERTYDANKSGVWARVKHERLGTDSGTGDFRSYNTMYQFGYDYTKSTENGKMIWGGAFDYMDGRTDYKSIEGDGGTDRTELSLYATYLGDSGFYGDLVIRGGKLNSDFDMVTPSGTALDADYDNWFYGLSFETGRQLENGTGWFVEPQVQMQYLRIASGDYSTAQTKVEQDAIDSLIGRAGFRVGKFLSDDKAQTVFFKTDVLREFMGEQKIRVTDVTTRVGGEDVSISNRGTWFDVGAGFQAAVSKDFYAYGDVEYRFGNDLWNTWVFNVGAKYRF